MKSDLGLENKYIEMVGIASLIFWAELKWKLEQSSILL